jgi:hypothetical protein
MKIPGTAEMPYSTVDTDALNRAISKVQPATQGEENCRELRLLDSSHTDRPYVEAFVQEVFYKAYQARLDTFYPLLLSITDTKDGSYAAVAGIRPAGGEPLFLEHYLDRPIEDVLGVERRKIIEIGNLAPANAGQARWLITTLNAFMLGAGFTHVVFTAVPRLKNAFSRMGLPLTELAEAHGDALPDEEKINWGSYYEARPKVFVGDLRVGEAPLTAVSKTDPFLDDLCQRATRAGQEFLSTVNNCH